MQIVFENEDERSIGGGANLMDFVIYTGRVSRCVKGEYTRRFGDRRDRI